MGSISRESNEPVSRDQHSLAVAGVVLAAVSLVFAILLAVASFAVAMFGGGVVVGVLVSPQARRGAAWLADYLKDNDP